MSKHNAGLEGPVGSWNDGLPRQHNEAGHIVTVVLDAIEQDAHLVKLGCPRTGYGRRVAEAVEGNELGGTGRVIESLAGDIEAELGERQLALGKRLRVADHPIQILFSHARKRQEAMMNRQLNLPNNVKPVVK